jgi:hypothetical protein
MLERIVGARVEQPLSYLWLALPPHQLIFSRNKWYV